MSVSLQSQHLHSDLVFRIILFAFEIVSQVNLKFLSSEVVEKLADPSVSNPLFLREFFSNDGLYNYLLHPVSRT
jgi:hypothetical protein